MKKYTFLLCMSFFALSCSNPQTKRTVLSLNGTWEIASSVDTLVPGRFTGTIQVPGLIDLASPAFENCGYKYSDYFSESSGDPEFQYGYFWYRKELTLDHEVSDFAVLKVHKTMFGHAVFVNGAYIGKYDFCFTPSFFDISEHLNFQGKNEILIRVGAHPYTLPDSIPFGWDIEKAVYYSGIYDRVELFLGNYPYLENAQIVPDTEHEKIRAVVYLRNGEETSAFSVDYVVREKMSQEVVATGKEGLFQLGACEADSFILDIPLPGCRLWSPEDPFLYEICFETPGDSRTFVFGIREFRFDAESKLAQLNGKPYYLRGTNVAMHRFFEDSLRMGLPWDKRWMEKMHDVFKEMHWNSYRFHVGFAPESWYETADEKGFLVQDEYAFWGWGKVNEKQLKRHTASILSKEYERWMRERWNHPSVVIWDAQNETITPESGKALEIVRGLDLSNRPWDNGWDAPRLETDMVESHPYLFAFTEDLRFNNQREWPEEGLLKNSLARKPFTFNDASDNTPPGEGKYYPNPIIINEYAWLWLYRDGTPAWASDHNWSLYSQFDTPEKRWEWRGRVVAAMTEYWRSRRDMAGVQYFCALTCERMGDPPTQVSDEWADVGKLDMQAGFKKFVKPAFAPVGLYIDKFDLVYSPRELIEVPVTLFNDLYSDWKGRITFEITQGVEIISEQVKQDVLVQSLGKTGLTFKVTIPEEMGHYEMKARIMLEGDTVFSSRLFAVQ